MVAVIPLVVAIVMTGWVAIDAARRQRNWLGWAILVGVTGPVGLIAWLFARRKTSDRQAPLGVGRATAIGLASIAIVLLQVIVAVFIVTFLVQVARVSGQSMAPTLRDQDRLLLNKWIYHTGTPQPGEIVMLRYPLVPRKVFVMRIMAREGRGSDRGRSRASQWHGHRRQLRARRVP